MDEHRNNKLPLTLTRNLHLSAWTKVAPCVSVKVALISTW